MSERVELAGSEWFNLVVMFIFIGIWFVLIGVAFSDRFDTLEEVCGVEQVEG